MLKMLWLAVLFVGAPAQSLQRQCLCSEVDRCAATAEQSLEHCAEKCKVHATRLGVSIPAARQCIMAQRGRIERAVSCVKASFGKVCTPTPGPMLTRRYPETIQIAAFREATSILNKAGILSQVTNLISAAKGAAACASHCGKEHPCYKLGCTLKLPSDNEVIATVKRCALQAGFNTQVAKEACACAVSAGLKQIAQFCPKIDMSWVSFK